MMSSSRDETSQIYEGAFDDASGKMHPFFLTFSDAHTERQFNLVRGEQMRGSYAIIQAILLLIGIGTVYQASKIEFWWGVANYSFVTIFTSIAMYLFYIRKSSTFTPYIRYAFSVCFFIMMSDTCEYILIRKDTIEYGAVLSGAGIIYAYVALGLPWIGCLILGVMGTVSVCIGTARGHTKEGNGIWIFLIYISATGLAYCGERCWRKVFVALKQAESDKLGDQRMNYVAKTSHDLRTPLNAFKLGLDVLTCEEGFVRDPHEVAHLAGMMQEALGIMCNTIDNLMLFAKAGTPAGNAQPSRPSSNGTTGNGSRGRQRGFPCLHRLRQSQHCPPNPAPSPLPPSAAAAAAACELLLRSPLLEPVPCHVPSLFRVCRSICLSYGSGLKHNTGQVDIQVDIGAEVPPWVLTDRAALQQMTLNLLTNARKFTHSQILLRVRTVPVEEAAAAAAAAAAAGGEEEEEEDGAEAGAEVGRHGRVGGWLACAGHCLPCGSNSCNNTDVVVNVEDDDDGEEEEEEEEREKKKVAEHPWRYRSGCNETMLGAMDPSTAASTGPLPCPVAMQECDINTAGTTAPHNNNNNIISHSTSTRSMRTSTSTFVRTSTTSSAGRCASSSSSSSSCESEPAAGSGSGSGSKQRQRVTQRWMLRVEVWDDGPGIPDTRKHRLFQAFEQLERDACQGTGLGLFAVRLLCEAMQGGEGGGGATYGVHDNTEAGKGAVFFFQLPLLPTPPPTTSTSTSNSTNNNKNDDDGRGGGCSSCASTGWQRGRVATEAETHAASASASASAAACSPSGTAGGSSVGPAIAGPAAAAREAHCAPAVRQPYTPHSQTGQEAAVAVVGGEGADMAGMASPHSDATLSTETAEGVRMEALPLLPLWQPRGESGQAEVSVEAGSRGGGGGAGVAKGEVQGMAEGLGRILVADDVVLIQKLMKKMLNREGYEVDIAGNGKEALQLMQSKKFKLVLMDLMMPIMDGFEAVELYREWEVVHRPGFHQQICALSANIQEHAEQRTRDVGMDGYMSKPFKKEKILEYLTACSDVSFA